MAISHRHYRVDHDDDVLPLWDRIENTNSRRGVFTIFAPWAVEDYFNLQGSGPYYFGRSYIQDN